MSQVFKIDQKIEGNKLTLSFAGDINENAEFSQLNLEGITELILDFEKVRFVNSIGLRSWIMWMKGIGTVPITFTHCPRYVVDQMNILEGFLPISAKVESIYVPYFCAACELTEMVLGHRGKDFMEATADAKEGVLLLDEKECPDCGQTSELDVLRERYFNFLKYRK